MIVQSNEFATYIYPFTDELAQAAVQDRIAVHSDGNVVWNREPWTPEAWIDYMAKMNAAMSKAFEIQRGKKDK